MDESLRQAIDVAGRAPSMFRSEPWRWGIESHQLELRVDDAGPLAGVDPRGRLVTLGCGIALDHALVALAAAGCWASVDRLPIDERPGMMARITPTGTYEPTSSDARLLRAVTGRRTDHRPCSPTPVPAGTVDRLRRIAESWGVYLTELEPDDLVEFQVSDSRAGEVRHLRTAPTDETPSTPRRIPLRALCPEGQDVVLPGPGRDRGARYLVLWSPLDDPASWLAAGEVISTILLGATAAELWVSPMSDVVETPISRTLVHSLLGNRGYAHAVLRLALPGAVR
ncbi:NAD(P)H nitroreductase [Cryptosporangium japonicum]|uniref:NAD(P)H nitroreductase n=1 Tax=Cryptosporangium japonicum TaxID=80872 RepID=A0ABP3D964_9ACTN